MAISKLWGRSRRYRGGRTRARWAEPFRK